MVSETLSESRLARRSGVQDGKSKIRADDSRHWKRQQGTGKRGNDLAL